MFSETDIEKQDSDVSLQLPNAKMLSRRYILTSDYEVTTMREWSKNDYGVMFATKKINRFFRI
jgi:hypothetical protein